MTASFGTLFTSSLRRVRTCMLPLLLAAFITSALSAVPTMIMGEEENDADVSGMLEAVLSGDEAQIDAMVELAETEDAPAVPADATDVALSAGFTVLSVLVSIVFGFYLLIVVTEGYSEPMPGFQRLPGLVFPIIGTSMWMFVKSYVWVPLLPGIGLLLWDVAQSGEPTPTAISVAVVLFLASVIIAIIRMPRLAFAPIILIREHTGIAESVRLSEMRTRGYWGKIVLNNLGFGIIAFIVMMVLFGVAGTVAVALVFLGDGSAVVATFAMVFVQLLVNAWNQAFHTELALTIFDHPKE